MPRLRQVARPDADPIARQMYDLIFGDRDPVATPGTATGTRHRYGDSRQLVDRFCFGAPMFEARLAGFSVLSRSPAQN